ncbi:MAG: cyclodeaminase/cyclohydrolase family protein [Syntrophobacteraceae bacterium]|nr:cyclodeaminase/cyclohydrolase family protein [Syntrophobacteraceae bacterium]
MGLTGLSVTEYVQRVAASTATPGGGSVCALVCSLCAALCLMAARLAPAGGEKKSDGRDAPQELKASLEGLLAGALALAEQDALAYDKVLAAIHLDRANEARSPAIEAAMKQASLIPLETLRTLAKIADLAGDVFNRGSPNCRCDVEVSLHLMRAAAKGSLCNLQENLSKIYDKTFTSRVQSDMTALKNAIEQATGRL